jgi:hypothetical protein
VCVCVCVFVCVFVCNFKVKFLMIEFVFKFFTNFQSKYLIQRFSKLHKICVCVKSVFFPRTQYSSVASSQTQIKGQNFSVCGGARWPDQGWQILVTFLSL